VWKPGAEDGAGEKRHSGGGRERRDERVATRWAKEGVVVVSVESFRFEAGEGIDGFGIEAFFFRMPPTSVNSVGHVPADWKCFTAQAAAWWRAARLEVKKVVREPKGWG
jgi:hypothetical protein